MRATSGMTNGRIRSRELLIAKAIQGGYNPYCRSTDAGARRVSDEMRGSVQGIRLPERRAVTAKAAKKPPIRELRVPARRDKSTGHHEVIALENFELVKRKPNRLSVGKLASVTACALILSAIVYGGSLINEEARRYSELSEGLEVLQKENQTLELELKEKNNLTVIEEIAKNDLGMIKVSAAEQRYLPLSAEDGISTYAQNEENDTFGMDMLNAFGEKISDFLEYLE